jgi:hypothetical protein
MLYFFLVMGLDAVEIILAWEMAFCIELEDQEVERLSTAQMAIDLISAKVGAIAQQDHEPLEELVFQRFQNAFSVVLQIPTEQIQHTSKLRTLLPKKKPKEALPRIYTHIELPEVPWFGWGVGILLEPMTVGSLVDEAIASYPRHFLPPDTPWTIVQVRTVVRAAIRKVIGTEDFQDNDNFIEIGIS